MDDGQALGSMDSEDGEDTKKSEEKTVEEPPKPEAATKSEEKPVEEPSKPQQASGIALPITEMTDDWMDDGQALGSMDSEDEEDAKKSEEKSVEKPPKPEAATKSEEKPVEEPSKPQQASGIALPITEMTDDWMDDGQALGSMDSEDEEVSKEAVKEEK